MAISILHITTPITLITILIGITGITAGSEIVFGGGKPASTGILFFFNNLINHKISPL